MKFINIVVNHSVSVLLIQGWLCFAGVRLQHTWNKTVLLAVTGEDEEMKRVKSNQTAAHSVVAMLASLPDFSTTSKQPLSLLALNPPAVLFSS